MSDGDLFREVDQAVRQERLRLFWARYGYVIIGVAALIVLIVAGYRGYVYWQEQQAQASGDEFAAAIQLADSAQPDKARAAFETLAKDGTGGYPALARFRLAAGDATAGKVKEAIAQYDELAKDRGIDPILRGNAVIQAATLRLPEADLAEIQRRVNGLMGDDNPWQYSARELVGLSAYRNGKADVAQEQFNSLLADNGTPANLRERATVMLAIIVGGSDAARAATPETKAD